jgi:hypothetical protein
MPDEKLGQMRGVLLFLLQQTTINYVNCPDPRQRASLSGEINRLKENIQYLDDAIKFQIENPIAAAPPQPPQGALFIVENGSLRNGKLNVQSVLDHSPPEALHNNITFPGRNNKLVADPRESHSSSLTSASSSGMPQAVEGSKLYLDNSGMVRKRAEAKIKPALKRAPKPNEKEPLQKVSVFYSVRCPVQY